MRCKHCEEYFRKIAEEGREKLLSNTFKKIELAIEKETKANIEQQKSSKIIPKKNNSLMF